MDSGSVNIQRHLDDTKARLQQELTRHGITITQQSDELVIKKGRIVGYVVAFSWEQPPVDRDELLKIIIHTGGYGTIKRENTVNTLQVSISET